MFHLLLVSSQLRFKFLELLFILDFYQLQLIFAFFYIFLEFFIFSLHQGQMLLVLPAEHLKFLLSLLLNLLSFFFQLTGHCQLNSLLLILQIRYLRLEGSDLPFSFLLMRYNLRNEPLSLYLDSTQQILGFCYLSSILALPLLNRLITLMDHISHISILGQ